jgi:phosphomannomutase/phosphoglucomutase
VTGSHNPPDYNGFKIVVGGETLSGKAIDDLYARIAEDACTTRGPAGMQRDVAQDYIDRISSDVQIDRRLKVVVDAGNGVAGRDRAAGAHRDRRGSHAAVLRSRRHLPEPPSGSERDRTTSKASSRWSSAWIADLGIAFDGDGDRLGVVTKEGKNIFPDRLLMLFAADVLERNPGAVIVYDVKCTGRLPGQILRHGGSPLMWKTGHSLIKGQDARDRRRARGRNERPLLLQGALVRLRRRHLRRRAPARNPRRRSQSPSEVLDALPDGVSTPEIKVERPKATRMPSSNASAQGEVRRCAPVDDRRPARGLARWLGPGARVQHDAGAGDALRRRQPRCADAHPGRLPRAAARAAAGLQLPF